MRYTKVLFINPPTKSFYGALRPPVGFGYLSEALLQNGIEYDVIDMLLRKGMTALNSKINSFKPDLIGLTMYSFGYEHTYEFIKEVKKNADLPIIVGGPHISITRQQALEECHSIDYGVVLEGEETLVEFCQGKEINEIKGLIYRNNGQVFYNGDRKFIGDLDSLSFPKYEKYELNKYLREKVIFSSRGCPYLCTYCAAAKALGKKYRSRSAENVVDEIAFWYTKGFRQFHFLDDNFSLIIERVYQICDEIEKRQLSGLLIRCTNGLRADKVDKKLLVRMREVGFKCLAFGVEAGNNKVLGNIKKGEKIEVIEQAIKEACELDYDVYLTFLVGSPGETWDDIMDSVKLALKYPVFRVDFYNIVPYPKTELLLWLKEKGYLLIEPEIYLNWVSSHSYKPVFTTPELTASERKRALVYTQKIVRKVLFNTVMRKLRKKRIYGFMVWIIAFVVSSGFVQSKLFSNTKFRVIAEKGRARFYGIKGEG